VHSTPVPLPPRADWPSINSTLSPFSPACTAAAVPEKPPPTTRMSHEISSVTWLAQSVSSSSFLSAAYATPAALIAIAMPAAPAPSRKFLLLSFVMRVTRFRVDE